MNSKMDYRPDIDGLRAIAILAVLFYHMGANAFSGGFVGVDVFFVISGYLITNMIVKEIEAKEFSILRFYERRIRRIFPAIFTVIAFTLAVSALLFDANEFLDCSKSVLATTLFLSNVLFWSQTGYFEEPSTLKPLLHTWSLAVEEQFYIFFPLLIVTMIRFFKSGLKTILILLTLVSFVLSAYVVFRDPSAAFYLAHLRAWELLIGSVLALNIIPPDFNTKTRNVLGLTGIALILTSVFLYTHDTPFPGITALLPTLGSALIIQSGIKRDTFAGKILSWGPLVFIGKISYSLYLWHWPLIVFGRYYIIREPTTGDALLWLSTSIAISTLSWKFIENPFRARTFLRRPAIFTLAGIAMALTLTAGAFVYFEDGLPHRFDSRHTTRFDESDYQWTKWKRCEVDINNIPADLTLCTIGADGQKTSFLFWGDSHVRALAPSVSASASRKMVSGYIVFASACPPLLGIDRVNRETCYQFNNAVLDYIKTHPELRTIILAARWSISANGNRYKTEEGESVKLVDIVSGSSSAGTNADLFNLGLNRTVRTLIGLGRDVVIVSQVPEVGHHVPSANSIAIRTGRDLNNIIAPTLTEYLERNLAANHAIDSIEQNYNVQVIDPSKALCDEQRCLVAIDGEPLYRDDDHLSTFGAEYISYIFDPLFAAIFSAEHSGE